MSTRAGTTAGFTPRTLAFVESPVQLLNVLEWAHAHAMGAAGPPGTPESGRGVAGAAGTTGVTGAAEARGAAGATGATRVAGCKGAAGAAGAAGAEGGAACADGAAGADGGTTGAVDASVATGATRVPGAAGAEATGVADAVGVPGVTGTTGMPGVTGAPTGAPGVTGVPGVIGAPGGGLTLVVLSPTDPMTRGQLRRMAELARNEGYEVRWEEARGGAAAPFRTVGGLAPLLRRAGRVVMGDPFSRYVQLLLTITRARELVVVDDGTATMEFVAQLARGERLVRWHRKGGRPGPRDLLFAPVSSSARRRLTPGRRRSVEIFSSMPIDATPAGVTVTGNDFAWTRARFGPPRITKGADMVGTSLVETGVVDGDRYLDAVRGLAKAHGATRYFAHRRESADKLHRLATETGLEVVRPDLPLELIARRGPIGRTVLSFPSTVVHTLPLALAGTGVRVAVCDIDPAWLTETASPRAHGFLSDVTGTARDVHRLAAVATA